jgi:hypothetical protein
MAGPAVPEESVVIYFLFYKLQLVDAGELLAKDVDVGIVFAWP